MYKKINLNKHNDFIEINMYNNDICPLIEWCSMNTKYCASFFLCYKNKKFYKDFLVDVFFSYVDYIN